ncbi:integrase [Sporomusaceae bacterium BoRhaA]|uniref:tyrosine-type recombinase/integrase n=1 Tax=Pelorhabdus rhamnosifermentans TaxID=2772457 RepID=UPI001C05F72F|nr:site-specific integrase [Pelorhabdus rhamnosifermentans]MBU2701754.1 integrase [Pelorhabdus rhamnosifermentans]
MSVQKKGDNYYAVVMYRDEFGKKKYKWVLAGTSSREAERLERKLRADMERGELVFSNKVTLKSFMEEWMDTAIKPKKRPSTVAFYQYHVDAICKEIGNVDLDKLTPLRVEKWLNKQEESGLSSTTIHGRFGTLKTALKKAVQWRSIIHNPCEAIEAPSKNRPKNATLTPDEAEHLMDLLQNSEIYLPTIIGIQCALRRGEVCGLRWQDIDLKNKKAFIKHSLDRMDVETAPREEKKGNVIPIWETTTEKSKTVLTLGKVKTDESENFISLPNVVLNLLKKEKLVQKQNKLSLGPAYHDVDFVWSKTNGLPQDPDHLYHAFTKMIKRHNSVIEIIQKCDKLTAEQKKHHQCLPLVRFHDLRHTHATLLLRNKVDTKVVSRQLRHRQASFTANYYQHVTKDMIDEPANVMDKIFGNKNIEGLEKGLEK